MDARRSGRRGFEFLRPIVNAMIKENPQERATMREAVVMFESIVQGLSTWKLRSQAIRIPGDFTLGTSWSDRLRHWWQKASNIARRLPAIPQARSDALIIELEYDTS